MIVCGNKPDTDDDGLPMIDPKPDTPATIVWWEMSCRIRMMMAVDVIDPKPDTPCRGDDFWWEMVADTDMMACRMH